MIRDECNYAVAVTKSFAEVDPDVDHIRAALDAEHRVADADMDRSCRS